MAADALSFKELRTGVAPDGRFVVGRHLPVYRAANLRIGDAPRDLGTLPDGSRLTNQPNLPPGDVDEPAADAVYEIPNAFPWRGVTYIRREWTRRPAADPSVIAIPPRPACSLEDALRQALPPEPEEDRAAAVESLFSRLPRPLKLAAALTSTDPRDLARLAAGCCRLRFDAASGRPDGLMFVADEGGRAAPLIHDRELFDAVANNPHLPDAYKEAMALRPGIQGRSEIVGEWRDPAGNGHIYEYLRRNSYIAYGHYAANMAEDAVRYCAAALSPADLRGLRHLYYQRTCVRLAELLGLGPLPRRRALSEDELEDLRRTVLDKVRRLPEGGSGLPFTATLWGWNYGFDYAPSGYRLHASHQQIHQQYALVPAAMPTAFPSAAPAGAPAGAQQRLQPFACGDLVYDFIKRYRRHTGKEFFEAYARAVRANERIDGDGNAPADLVVHDDGRTMLFVPKAQTSQWELQLMTLGRVGNILEADTATRRSLDSALLTAMRVLTAMGAEMITVFEYSKRFTVSDEDQRLLYVFLPRLPESPGGFSEAQLRWICGHFPEDFARACRARLAGQDS